MIFLRFFSWVLVALAIAVLGADGINTLETGKPVVRTLQEIISLSPIKVSTMSGDNPFANFLNFLLEAPFWMVAGIPGAILAMIFRPID